MAASNDPNQQQIIELLTQILAELQLQSVTRIDPALRGGDHTKDKIKLIRQKSKDINNNGQ